MRDISYRVALGGIISALGLLCMFLAGIIPALYLVLPMIAGVLLMIIVEEVSLSWGWLTYLSISILAFFTTADKEAALVFAMLFGHYPILRYYLGRIKVKPLRWTAKFAVFNICAVAYFYVTVFIFGIQQMLEEMNDIGRYGSIIFLCVCNLIFVLYDINLGAMYKIYIKKLLPRFTRRR